MAILWPTFIIFALVTSLAHAGEGAEASCQTQVTIDDQYNLIEDSDLPAKVKAVAYTELLNAAFTPHLVKVHEGILKMTQQEIRSLSAAYGSRLVDGREELANWNQLGNGGFDRKFDGILHYHVDGRSVLHRDKVSIITAPYTRFNKKVMKKLSLTLTILNDLLKHRFPIEADLAIQQSLSLRCQRTFVASELDMQMYYGVASIAQSAAALTAEKVAGLSAEKLFTKVMTQHGATPSLVAIHSLILPPAVLGPNGDVLYLAETLSVTDKHQLTFSPKFRGFMKKLRENFQKREKEAYEFGSGCPVGHTMNGMDRSGLQYFLDATMHIYRNI